MSNMSVEVRAQEMVKKENLKRAREWQAKAEQSGNANDWDKAADYYEAAGYDLKATSCRLTAQYCRGVK